MEEYKYNTTKNKQFRRNLRKNGTPAEGAMWRILKNKKVLGLRFLRQYSVGKYVLDFYCPEVRLCIELDGEVHKNAYYDAHDAIRTEYLKSLGIEVLRIENSFVWQCPDDIVEHIKEIIEKRQTR